MGFRLGELFCGPGGLALGAVTADIGDRNWRITHAWANDKDPDTCRTYCRNICPDRPESVICADVRIGFGERWKGVWLDFERHEGGGVSSFRQNKSLPISMNVHWL